MKIHVGRLLALYRQALVAVLFYPGFNETLVFKAFRKPFRLQDLEPLK